MEQLISIIVPVYKVEAYIRRCVDSILAQTYQKIEVILVDDGSPDCCPGICDEYASKDNRVIVVHKDNGGLSDARNAGLRCAHGDFVSFVDSDDYIAPNMIEKLYLALCEAKADMSICNFRYVSEFGDKEYDNENLPISDECITPECYLNEKLFEKKSHYWVISCCKLYSKILFQNVEFDKGKTHEDEFILHKIVTKCKKIACISDMLYYYVQRDDSIMHQNISIKKLDSVEALFNRASFLSTLPSYQSSSYKYLKRGIGFYYAYYRTSNEKKESLFSIRSKELQELFRDVLESLKRRRVQMEIKVSLFFLANYVSMKAMAFLFSIFIK